MDITLITNKSLKLTNVTTTNQELLPFERGLVKLRLVKFGLEIRFPNFVIGEMGDG